MKLTNSLIVSKCVNQFSTLISFFSTMNSFFSTTKISTTNVLGPKWAFVPFAKTFQQNIPCLKLKLDFWTIELKQIENYQFFFPKSNFAITRLSKNQVLHLKLFFSKNRVSK